LNKQFAALMKELKITYQALNAGAKHAIECF